MMSSGPKIGLYLGLVFLSGTVVGGFGHRLYSAKEVNAAKPKSHNAFRAQYLKEMETRLTLDGSQMKTLVQILDESKDRYKSLRDKMDPEMKQIQSDQRDKIRAILNENQKLEYEKLLEQREKRRKEGPSPGND